MQKSERVSAIILKTVKSRLLLSVGILLAVAGAIATSLFPPLILGKIIDTITAGQAVTIAMVVLYFLLIALTGFTEAAREGLLTIFGQKITHTLRSRLMAKQIRLTADALNHQEPGALVSRFVGDVDAVESLFTSGIVSMFADACRINQHSGGDLVSKSRISPCASGVVALPVLVYPPRAEEYAGRPAG